MDTNNMCRFIIFTVILTTVTTQAQVINPPNNVTVRRGSWATFVCDMASPQNAWWAKYIPGMELLSSTAKYSIENSSSLVIRDTDFSDGLTYSCMDPTKEPRPHYANLVVVDRLKASIDPPGMASFGDNITLICSLNYGGPTHDNLIYPLSPDQDPRISMFLGNEDLTSVANASHVPGTAVQPMHSKTLSVSRNLTEGDLKKDLRCYVSSIKPFYEDSDNISLPFSYSSRTVAIDIAGNTTSDMSVYAGTILNCSADGIPAPRVTWTPIGKNPSSEVVKAEPGYSVLKLVGVGYHNWNCTASNDLSVAAQAYRETNLTVVAPFKPAETKTGSVGLGIGLGVGIGILVVLIIILVVVFLKRNKFSGNIKPNASQKKSLFGKNTNSSGIEKTTMIYKPQPFNDKNIHLLPSNPNGVTQNPNSSYDRVSDASSRQIKDGPGHADLGVKTLGASGSMPRLNESFDSMDERNYNREPKSRNHSSYDDEQFYPSRYHKAAATRGADTTV